MSVEYFKTAESHIKYADKFNITIIAALRNNFQCKSYAKIQLFVCKYQSHNERF